MKKHELKKGDLIMVYNQLQAIVLETNQDNQFVDPKIAYYGKKNRIVIQGVNPYYINFVINRCC